MSSETPDTVYGRLLESAHISGYSFERVCAELNWLLDEGRWQKVSPGHNDINAFISTVDLSPFNMSADQRRPLIKRLEELKAKQRAIAQAVGVHESTISRELHPPKLALASQESSNELEIGDGESPKLALASQESAAWVQQDASEVAKQAQKLTEREAREDAAQARRGRSRSAEPLPDGMDLRIGDAREVLANVPDESVALVLTDPPYVPEADPLWIWMAEWATRVLVPGGSVVTFTAHARLDRDIDVLGRWLRYWWLLARLQDAPASVPGRFVTAEFKPVLWFVKDHRRGRSMVTDVIRAPRDAAIKTLHPWAQSTDGLNFLIEHLTEPSELVADPFAGTGRWGELAVSMGRRWVGADIALGGTDEVLA